MIIEQKPKLVCDRCGAEICEWHDNAVEAWLETDEINHGPQVVMRRMNHERPNSEATAQICSISCRNAWLYDALRSGEIELTDLGAEAMPPAAMDAEVTA